MNSSDNNIKIERKALLYGLAELLSNKTGKNIRCEECTTEKYIPCNKDDIWTYDTNITYTLMEDDMKIISLTDVNKTIKGIDEFVDYKGKDLDRYMTYSVAKLLFLGMSIKYDVDIMNVIDDIAECKKARNIYVNTESINDVFKNYISEKKLIK